MPNRRRRKLSTAMSAVAALAVASPCAYFLVYESTSGPRPAEHHEFKQAAVMTDLPNELMGALSQGLSQFGVNLPPIPALGGASGGAGGLGTTGLTSPGLGTSGLTSPGLASPGLGASPALGTPGLTSPGLGTPGLTSPGLSNPGLPGTPGVPATPGLTSPGALTQTPGTGLNPLASPGLSSPAGLTPGGAGFSPSEVPISADPGADGTYPILGDPSTLGGGGAGSGGNGGLVNDVMQAANQLGAGQAIDMLKGLVMPAIMQASHGGAPGALPGIGGLPGAAGGLPGVGGLPGAAGALPGAAAALPPALPPV